MKVRQFFLSLDNLFENMGTTFACDNHLWSGQTKPRKFLVITEFDIVERTKHALKPRVSNQIQRTILEEETTMTPTQIQSSPKRRDKLMIMAEIINYARAGALKTQIMYKANLSFTQLTQYLQFLTRNKLLEKSPFDGKEVYKATQKGMDFVEKQQQIVNLLNEDAQGNRAKSLPAKLEKSLSWTKNNSKYSIILRSCKQP